MVKNALKRNLVVAWVACLSLFAAGGCTYNYFEDETNFLLHVPQIESGEITNFYVSFHRIESEGGGHVLTRKVSAPFDRIEGGVMKFKIPPGRYDISTFADFDEGLLTEGQQLSASFNSGRPLDAENNLYVPEDGQPRARFLRNQMVSYFGTTEAEELVEDDINENYKLKGEVVCRFVELPVDGLTGIRVSYKGLSTRYGFDGTFNRFTNGDAYCVDHAAVAPMNTADIVISNFIFPSSGLCHEPRDPSLGTNPEEMELQIEFYAGNSLRGRASLTPEEFRKLETAQKPVDKDGNPLSSLVLRPRDKVMILFKGFTVIGIGLDDWNDPSQGGTIIH